MSRLAGNALMLGAYFLVIGPALAAEMKARPMPEMGLLEPNQVYLDKFIDPERGCVLMVLAD
jgi:hypothetical protein